MNVWSILGILAGLVALGLVRRWRAARSGPRITVDADGIRRDHGSLHEAVRWSDLERIVIMTTDEGPLCDDVYWLFIGRDGAGCALPGSAVGDAVFEALSRLPGVDYAAIVAASGSVENASFEVWKRSAAANAA